MHVFSGSAQTGRAGTFCDVVFRHAVCRPPHGVARASQSPVCSFVWEKLVSAPGKGQPGHKAREVGPRGGSMGLGQELVLDAQKGVTDEFQCAIW